MNLLRIKTYELTPHVSNTFLMKTIIILKLKGTLISKKKNFQKAYVEPIKNNLHFFFHLKYEIATCLFTTIVTHTFYLQLFHGLF